jgi:glycosyltransferase involved in cell wall biosynthesis
VDEITLSDRDDGYLLVAARMLAYRRLDVAVEAARRLDRRLILVGDGPERRRLEAMAGPKTEFRGHVSRSDLVELFAHCSAYVVPGVEDFGIAPVEAMAAGKPVVALRAGGARETVVDGVTGVFFERPDARLAAEAITSLDHVVFDRAAIRRHAETFDRRVFLQRWCALFERLGVDPSLYSRP